VTDEPRPAKGLRPALRGLREGLSPVIGWLGRHRIGQRALVCLTALAGALVAVTLWGSVHSTVGPVRATFTLQTGVHGGTEIDIPPLGRLMVRSHAGPIRVHATVTGVNIADAQRALDGETTRDQLEAQVTRDARRALVHLVAKWVVLAVLGGALAVLIVFRRPRPVVLGVSTVGVALVATGAVAVSTWNTDAFSTPKASGVLTSASTLIGGVEDIPEKFDTYRHELAKIVANVSKLYDATRALPGSISADAIPVLWVSDIHDNPEAFTVMQSIVTQFGAKAVVDTGDISDHGTAAENPLYNPITRLKVPYIYVRGNHDSRTTQRYLASLPNVHVLDRGKIEKIAGITWAGIGDPNFTPDRTVDYGHEADPSLVVAGQRLATSIDVSGLPVDVALVHEPTMAGPLDGHVRLVLDGHIHRRDHQSTPQTLTLTQGSSGGAGLRNLEGAVPLPLEMSVLYFDPTTRGLLAVDDITLSGLGVESVQIQRHRASSYRAKDGTQPSPEPSSDPSS
jgi:predicted phosphodiesterase